MISILIPVFNYDVAVLVTSLREAMDKVPEFSELIVGDDGSASEYRQRYEVLINGKVRLVTAEKNIGRAAIRNRLAAEAGGKFLLFIDADAMITSTAENYLRSWLPFLNCGKVICGGVLYPGHAPADPDKILRWKYGRKREQRKPADRNKRPHENFSGFNFMIERDLYLKIRFNEELRQYGHEDTLFGYQMRKAGVDICHVDSALIHDGVETNSEYIGKIRQGIENLSILCDKVTDYRAFSETVRLVRMYNLFSSLGLSGILAAIYIRYRDRMELALDSSKASLSLLWLFRISLFSTYRAIHRRRNILPVL